MTGRNMFGKKDKKPVDPVRAWSAYWNWEPMAVEHVSGLPLPEGAPCTVASVEGAYRIESGGATFRLDKSKVTGVSTATEEEIEKQYVSSVGRAALGGVLAGAIGVIIGGMAQKKVLSRKKRSYLFITWNGDSGAQCAAFGAERDFKNGKRQDFFNTVKEFEQCGFGSASVVEL